MTGYHISLGYGSQHAKAWRALLKAATKRRNDSAGLAEEAYSFGAPLALDGEELADYCDIYGSDVRSGSPVRIVEDAGDVTESQVIVLCSGGDPSRTLKEHVARAFCRLVIADMHRLGYEVNLAVV